MHIKVASDVLSDYKRYLQQHVRYVLKVKAQIIRYLVFFVFRVRWEKMTAI